MELFALSFFLLVYFYSYNCYIEYYWRRLCFVLFLNFWSIFISLVSLLSFQYKGPEILKAFQDTGKTLNHFVVRNMQETYPSCIFVLCYHSFICYVRIIHPCIASLTCNLIIPSERYPSHHFPWKVCVRHWRINFRNRQLSKGTFTGNNSKCSRTG